MNLRHLLLPVLLCAATTASGIKTQSLTHSGYELFSAGQLERVSLSSQGILSLSRDLQELAQLDQPVIWRGILDQQGRLIIGTGSEGIVYRLDPASEEPKLETLFAPGEVLVRALAIDNEGVVYVGTSPNGRVYRIPEGERAQIFFDPDEAYVWDMRFDQDGHLLVATGQGGKIYRLPPDFREGDEAPVWFQTAETHVTVLAFDQQQNLLAGTAPEAALYRITGKDEGDVLYNAAANEVSGIHVRPDGTILFSVFSENNEADKGKTPLDLPKILESFQRSTDEANPDAGDESQSSSEPARLPSFLYRIDPSGFVEPWWTPGSSKIYSFLQDGEDLLIGTDEQGSLYQVRGRNRWALLQNVPNGGQLTGLLPTGNDNGDVLVFTSNPASVYLLKGEPATEGEYISTVIDAKQIARWGNLRPEGLQPNDLPGMAWFTRSGNSPNPEANWSAWKPLDGQKIASPQARFLQYKGKFTDAGAGVRAVRAFYQHQNFAPVINRVNILPVQIQLVNVPMTKKPNIGLNTLLEGTGNVESTAEEIIRRQFRVLGGEGYVTAGWKAFDANGDRLLFDVELRGDGEMRWVKLAEKIDVPAFSLNTRGFQDGYYEVRVSATDSLSNPPGEALTGYNLSEPFLVDNSPPQVELVSAKGDSERFDITFRVSDAFSIIDSAEYILDGQEPRLAVPGDGLFDASVESIQIELRDLRAGTHSILLRTRDESGNAGIRSVVIDVPETGKQVKADKPNPPEDEEAKPTEEEAARVDGQPDATEEETS